MSYKLPQTKCECGDIVAIAQLKRHKKSKLHAKHLFLSKLSSKQQFQYEKEKQDKKRKKHALYMRKYRNQEKVRCTCGHMVNPALMNAHLKTARHLQA